MPRGSRPGERRGGRQKGTPNRLTREIREMIREALEDLGGREYLKEQGEKNPQAFLALIGKLIPSEVKASLAMEKPVKIEVVTGFSPESRPPQE